MTEHGLDAADIGAVDEEVGGVAVSESMRGDLLHDAGNFGIFGDDALDASGGETAVLVFVGAIDVDEEEWV